MLRRKGNMDRNERYAHRVGEDYVHEIEKVADAIHLFTCHGDWVMAAALTLVLHDKFRREAP